MSSHNWVCRDCGSGITGLHEKTCVRYVAGPVVYGYQCITEDEYNVEKRNATPPKTATEVMKRPHYEAVADNSGHRGAKIRCRTCIWFVGKENPYSDPLSPQMFGRCRRHAPTLGGWAPVHGSDWCGDHELYREKS